MKSFIPFGIMGLLGIVTAQNSVLRDAADKARNSSCEKGYFLCQDDTCIYDHVVCDGYEDCTQGDDEINCTSSCKKEEFHCSAIHRCIPRYYLCDGDDDCTDGADENIINCSPLHSTEAYKVDHCGKEFTCKLGDCVPWSKVCDGLQDCLDFSDEGHRCSSSCQVNNGGCSHICQKTPQPEGARCFCHTGYKLLPNGKLCEDIDECQEPGRCSQLCNNTIGGFKCSCAQGYFLDHNNRTCKVDDGNATLVILLPDQIKGIDLSSHMQRTYFSAELLDMRGVDYDNSEEMFFWTEWKESVITYYSPDINRIDVLVKTQQRPHFLKWDWMSKNMYFTDEEGSIRACSRNGKYCTVVVKKPAVHINSLEIDPISGFLFWSVWSTVLRRKAGVIEKAEMDGGRRIALISTDIFWPTALNVDHALKYVYWIDGKLNTIECADYNGLNRREIVRDISYYPFSMVLFEDYVFWSDWGTDSILKCDRFTGKNCSTFQKGNVKAETLVVIHKARQPQGENRCLNSGCLQMCLSTRTGYSCKCDENDTYCDHTTVASSFPKPRVKVACPEDYCRRNATCIVVAGGQNVCQCRPPFHGDRCEKYGDDVKEPVYNYNSVVVFSILAVSGALVVVVLLSRRNRKKLLKLGENVVKFRNPRWRDEKDKQVALDINNQLILTQEE